MPIRDPQALLDVALSLPDAQPADFLPERRPSGEIAPNLLKVINDTALRSRLIGAGLAEGLQSPKGPQKIASIIRVYPEFNAPATPKASSGGRYAASKPGRKPNVPQPSVEEMEALLTRLRAVEGHVARELSMSIQDEIDQARKRVAEAAPQDVENAFRELGALLDKQRDGRRHVREAAFAKIAGDKEFAPRVFLRLLSHEITAE